MTVLQSMRLLLLLHLQARNYVHVPVAVPHVGAHSVVVGIVRGHG